MREAKALETTGPWQLSTSRRLPVFLVRTGISKRNVLALIIIAAGTLQAFVNSLRDRRIQRFAHVCFRKWGSICIDGGALLMNTGRSVCDLNRHALSLLNTHSLIKSATIIGGFD